MSVLAYHTTSTQAARIIAQPGLPHPGPLHVREVAVSAAPEKQSRFLALQRVNRAYVARRYAIVVSRGRHGRAPGNEVTLTLIPEESRDWILAYVPIRALNYQTGDESGAPRISRARAYAARSGPLPPGIAKYGKYAIRRGFEQAYIADGNHRVMAATLRGDLAIRMYMPLPDYVALVRAVGGQISRPTSRPSRPSPRGSR